MITWRRCCRLRRRHIDIISRTHISQLFARLFLNRLFVGLQPLNLLGVEIIFFLLLRDPPLQQFVLHSLLFVNDHPICPKHHVHKQKRSQHSHRDGRDAPAKVVGKRNRGLHSLDPPLRLRLSLWHSSRNGAQSLLGTGELPDFDRALYSKIHSFAAALSSLSPRWLRASV